MSWSQLIHRKEKNKITKPKTNWNGEEAERREVGKPY